jgi:hypothetical protein
LFSSSYTDIYSFIYFCAPMLSTNNIPAVLGKTLRIKVVVSDVFREVLRLKGAKIIYTNVVIDASQNRYIRLEPL